MMKVQERFFVTGKLCNPRTSKEHIPFVSIKSQPFPILGICKTIFPV